MQLERLPGGGRGWTIHLIPRAETSYTLPAPTIAVMRLAVHPNLVLLCSGSMKSLASISVSSNRSGSNRSGFDFFLGAKNGDFVDWDIDDGPGEPAESLDVFVVESLMSFTDDGSRDQTEKSCCEK